jgi:hypothetical protein
MMYGNGQAAVSTRVAISVIVLYALVLQAYIAAAAPALGFNPAADARCAPGDARQDGPGRTNQDHHCLCCVLACAACACAFAATAPSAAAPPRQVTTLTFALAQSQADRARPRLSFAARGPPARL